VSGGIAPLLLLTIVEAFSVGTVAREMDEQGASRTAPSELRLAHHVQQRAEGPAVEAEPEDRSVDDELDDAA
jgi:hypothetical protein